ncbi:transposase [Streptomyces sp. NBC_00249]|uniref:IS66 family transposase n=1 Tax=Streptomyces sp. NBC_00249 TaxID=2975690 RepID=UPI00224D095A|nr:transposase [Streptomyces sp. NBC_00249]MCX5195065.1 transposase [Streptomyces sp. NBC_00249]
MGKYVHTATTPGGLVFLGAHKRRSHKATDSLGILGNHQDVLRDFNTAVETAKAAGHTRLDPNIAAELAERYKHAHLVGRANNTGRRTSKGKRRPAWVMAETLHKRQDEILLFTRRFDVPWTNNAAERALRMAKSQMCVSGCWRRVETAD